eukprot:GHVS01097985.1.p1 GENE.GHVS01097985.1~~GHVS01097985.1.p1  ORF type:complete len:180 (-),score=17.11 GHVS01097985.1:493-1032(-)
MVVTPVCPTPLARLEDLPHHRGACCSNRRSRSIVWAACFLLLGHHFTVLVPVNARPLNPNEVVNVMSQFGPAKASASVALWMYPTFWLSIICFSAGIIKALHGRVRGATTLYLAAVSIDVGRVLTKPAALPGTPQFFCELAILTVTTWALLTSLVELFLLETGRITPKMVKFVGRRRGP